jgi:AraC-like DNA-binding protein
MHGPHGAEFARQAGYRTTHLDEARLVIARYFYANRIDLLAPDERFSASFDLSRMGDISLGDVRFTSDLRMRFGELGAYHVDLPLSGVLAWHQGRADLSLATTSRAAVFQPTGDATLDRWNNDCRLLAVKIERRALHEHLEHLLGTTISTPPRLSPTMDVTEGPGRTWAQTAIMIAGDMTNPRGLLTNPLLAGPLREALLTGLLLAADDPHRDALMNPASCPATQIKAAVDVIEAHPERPFTVSALAEVAAVSVRTLQHGFQRHLDMSPMGYLRQVRLARAHQDLSDFAPDQVTVAQIAHKWGFGHVSRFAAAYRRRYGVCPSTTLRAATPTRR